MKIRFNKEKYEKNKVKCHKIGDALELKTLVGFGVCEALSINELIGEGNLKIKAFVWLGVMAIGGSMIHTVNDVTSSSFAYLGSLELK